jgi:hypothetical protein
MGIALGELKKDLADSEAESKKKFNLILGTLKRGSSKDYEKVKEIIYLKQK